MSGERLAGGATACLIAFAFAAATATSALGAAGNADTTFSQDGFASIPVPQPDGASSDIFVAGGAADAAGGVVQAATIQHRTNCYRIFCSYSQSTVVTRFAPDGSPDTGFGSDGLVTASELPSDGDWRDYELRDVVVQPDGKIVLAGADDDRRVVWAGRLNPDGSPDATFGGDGAVRVDLAGGPANGGSSSDSGDAVALSPSGQIVIAGVSAPSKLARQYETVVLTPDGELDPSFAGTGFVLESGLGEPYLLEDLHVAGDGRIILLGRSYEHRSVDLLAYRPDGSRDASFSTAAMTGLANRQFGRATEMAIDRQDRILLAESVDSSSAGDQGGRIARLEPSGAIDPAFGDAGLATLSPPPTLQRFGFDDDSPSIAVDEQSRPLISGGRGALGVTRYTENGILDSGFGSAGWATLYPRERFFASLGVTTAGRRVIVFGGSGNALEAAALLSDDGPPDRDGDGTSDENEECPLVFGDCPAVARSLSHLVLRRHKEDLSVRGVVISDDAYCQQGTVTIFRREPGDDPDVVQLRTNGYFKFDANNLDPGVYYAVADRRRLDYGFCPQVVSKQRRIDASAFHDVQPARIGIYPSDFGEYLFLNARYSGKRDIEVAPTSKPNVYEISDSHRLIPRTDGCRQVRPTAVRCRAPNGGLVIWGSDRKTNRIEVDFDGSVFISAGGSRDVISVTAESAEVFLGDGSDVYFGISGADDVWGDRGADEIRTFGGEDWIEGNKGRDTIFSGGNDDRVYAHGGDADRLLDCGPGKDRIFRDRNIDPKPQECEEISGQRGLRLVPRERVSLHPSGDK